MNTSRTRGGLRRARSRLAVTLSSCAILSGCGGGGTAGDIGALPPAAPSDSLRVADVNRRILAAGSAPAAATPAADYRVGPHDMILVDVFGADTFSGEYRVEENGEIAFPLLGSIPAAGSTPRELEVLIASRLRDTYMRDPHVAIQVLEVRSQGVSVMGAVNAPGVYQVPGRASLLQVLAMAEGLAAGAGNRVYVVRPLDARSDASRRLGGASQLATTAASGADAPGGSTAAVDPPDLDDLGVGEAEIIEVDLAGLLEGGRVSQNIDVHGGDIVQVRPAGLVYVVGEVNRPGGFTMPAGAPLTALQAIAMAEGLGRTARASGAMIVRERDDGSRQEIPVNLEDMLEGEAPAPQLEARDVLFVPNNSTKAFALGVVNALVSMVTLRGLFY